ncbi:hypothetical protein A9978_19025 [Pseudomonas sp. UMC65]|uniref:hypothetical protein n=1 Tax=Pseudomonas sp. UMC65 TaxID=1862323 RepID=UPI0016024DD1|nr:hypothetical protein [Pseudomonas sp. UMC65]MBB1614533.1 hypothetical protein [Pseudomonas sp. UMC65]
MAFEAYSVAVKLSLINHVSAGLALISRGLHTAGQDAERLNRQLASIGRQGAIGAVMAAGGLGIAAMFKAPLDEAKKFQNETERFRSLGLGDAVTADAVKFSKGMNTYGTSIRENLSLLRDAQTVFGDYHEAQMVTPLLAKMKFANAALYGDEGGAMKDKAFMDMLKVIEMRGGLSSQEAFNKQANMVQQVQTATGGRVGANEYLNFIGRGGVAAKGMKDEVFYYTMEPLIQEMKGAAVGVGLMSGYQNLVQGRTTARAANELMRLGMLDPAKVEYNKIGNIKQIKPGALAGSDLMVSDPFKWMQTVMLPAFASKGITEKQAILNEIGAIFTNRTASSVYSTMFLQQAQIEKNIKLNSGAAGIDELEKNAKNTLSGKQIEFGAQWHNLMLNLGNVVLPLAIAALDKLNPALKKLGVWMDENPGKVKAFTYALLGLSAFLIGGGLINMVIAAGRGFLLLGQAIAFLGGPLVPIMARFGTYLVMFVIDSFKAVGMFLTSGFLRGMVMAFLSPLKLLGQGIFFLGRALLMNPIGLAITAIAVAAFLLWNNWKEVSGALTLMWGDLKTGFIKLFNGDIGGAFKSFALIFLTGWQTIFNTLIAGANLILPASMQLTKTTFADDFRGSNAPKQPWSPLVAPVPGKADTSKEQPINLYIDGQKVSDVVIQRMAKEAAKPQTGTQGFDPSRSMLMPGTPSTAYPRG